MKQVGIEIPKVDALEKALGIAKYGADLPAQEALYLKVVRSPRPHAKIVRIETEEALRIPDVQRIFTAKDILGKNLVGTITKDQPVLASDRVRYIGDPVVLIAAKTEEAADEAAKKVISGSNKRVLGAQTEIIDGREVHVIKVLTPDGRIQHYLIDAETGEIIG